MNEKTNIVLIGMPGVGKSTVGVLLAKASGKGFIDTDLLIQQHKNCRLQDIVDIQGYQYLREIESQLLETIVDDGLVIATGGSAVHSESGMRHLAKSATIVHIDADIDTLLRRIDNFSTRGIAARPNASFEEIFAQRQGLYQRYADLTVRSDNLNADAVVNAIMRAI